MCQFSDREIGDELSPIAQSVALRTKQTPGSSAVGTLSSTRHQGACLQTPSPGTFTVQEHCIRGWWRASLFNTSKELKAQSSSFSSHVDTLCTSQKRMHVLARKCTQARLYPNPTSSNSKAALKAQLGALEADMNSSINLHDLYSAALHMYTLPVQAVVDSLNMTDKECHCSDCSRRIDRWKSDTNTEIRLEAEGLVHSLYEIDRTFKKLYKDLLSRWEETGREGLRSMVDALPEQHDLKSKTVVKKYFPRQLREIEEAEGRTIRKPTIVGRSDSRLQDSVYG